MIKTSKQLKDLVGNRAHGDSAKSMLFLRNYAMERFLERLSASKYRNCFILKPSVASTPRPVRPVVQTQTASQPKAQPQITQTAFTINIGDEVKKVRIPNSVKDVFTNEVQIPEDNDIATTENVAHVAMLLFAGYIDAATSISESCGGGGSAPSSGWGKKDDEDDWKFAHRCAQMAHSMCKPKPRSRSFHR